MIELCAKRIKTKEVPCNAFVYFRNNGSYSRSNGSVINELSPPRKSRPDKKFTHGSEFSLGKLRGVPCLAGLQAEGVNQYSTASLIPS